jgi:hypothetical protein
MMSVFAYSGDATCHYGHKDDHKRKAEVNGQG